MRHYECKIYFYSIFFFVKINILQADRGCVEEVIRRISSEHIREGVIDRFWLVSTWVFFLRVSASASLRLSRISGTKSRWLRKSPQCDSSPSGLCPGILQFHWFFDFRNVIVFLKSFKNFIQINHNIRFDWSRFSFSFQSDHFCKLVQDLLKYVSQNEHHLDYYATYDKTVRYCSINKNNNLATTSSVSEVVCAASSRSSESRIRWLQ